MQRLSDPPRTAPEIALQSHDNNADIGITGFAELRETAKASIRWRGCVRRSFKLILSAAGCLNGLTIAPLTAGASRRFRVTHPFHPLSGKLFDLVERRCIFAQSYLYFHDDCGHLREIPASWTDFVKEDALVEIAGGRSPLHAGCLLELAEFVQHLAGKGV